MGHQETVEEMRAEKAEKFVELKEKKGSPEYEEWFLRYRPVENADSDSEKKGDKNKNKKKRVQTLKSRQKQVVISLRLHLLAFITSLRSS